MKTLRLFTLIFITFLFVFSCSEKTKTSKQVTSNSSNIALKKSELTIKGMTCEIGCAKLIQSKLAKTDGIKFVEVSFKDSIAMIEYNTNKLNISKIKNVITNIAGGDLYLVTDNKEVTQFSHLKNTNIN